MSQTMKLQERVIEHLLRHETTSENQFCFMSGWFTMEPIFLIKCNGKTYRGLQYGF